MTRIIRRALWIFGPPALGIIFAISMNSALKEDGWIVGNPRMVILHVHENEKAAFATEGRLVTGEAQKTICGKFQMPGCPAKHGRAG